MPPLRLLHLVLRHVGRNVDGEEGDVPGNHIRGIASLVEREVLKLDAHSVRCAHLSITRIRPLLPAAAWLLSVLGALERLVDTLVRARTATSAC
jgi:hypothetical protein